MVLPYHCIMKKEGITLKGDRKLWKKFAIKLKIEDKEIWDILGKFIERYLKK